MRHRILAAAVVGTLAAAASGCGEFARESRAPVLLVVDRLEAGAGAEPSLFQGTLRSDVVTNGSIFDDMARVTARIILKDPGAPGATTAPSPTALNAVTVRRYRVTYRRSDGRNTPGVDVPYPFDSAATFTVTPGASVQAVFELVRHTAKLETPLRQLADCVITATTPQIIPQGCVILSTIADVTFFGHDQAGNDISADGSIGVLFGNFADPN
jgi:hypothetical protein